MRDREKWRERGGEGEERGGEGEGKNETCKELSTCMYVKKCFH